MSALSAHIVDARSTHRSGRERVGSRAELALAPQSCRTDDRRRANVADERFAHDAWTDLLDAERQLRHCGSMSELFAVACEAARVWCGFSRSLIVSVEGQTLTTSGLPELSDPASDALRRELLERPVKLRAATAEAEFISLAEGGGTGASSAPSLLGPTLGLEHVALGAVMPEDRVLALLVLDRSSPGIEPSDRHAVALFARVLASLVERLFLRQRVGEFVSELRQMSASAQALVGHGGGAAVELSTESGADSGRRIDPGPDLSDDVRRLFTRRELDIAAQLLAGYSNRDIAAHLQISPDTVKAYVGRVMRKLGAANRADAAVRYLRLTSPSLKR